MSNKIFMSHTNATLGVVTFEPAEDNPLEINAMVHHVIGWMVSEHSKPIPLSTTNSPKWFQNKRFYTIFLPEGVVIDPLGEGTSLTLEEAMKHFQGELLAQDKEENPKPAYNH